VRAELDVRVGGRFRASFSTDDGEYHEIGGIYREVTGRPVFSWAWHSTPGPQPAHHPAFHVRCCRHRGLPGCSFCADHVDAAFQHLVHHDVSFVAVSRAPLSILEAYHKRMGWNFKWVSSGR
jgi:uncharacterized protein YndB with AHSA1/START domain